MKKWLMVGGGLLLLAWGPFLYAELTSDPAERKERDLPSDHDGDDPLAAAVEVEDEKAAAGKAAEPTPATEAPEPEELPAEPEQVAAPPPAEPAEAPNAPAEPVAAAAPEGEEAEAAEGEEVEEPAPPPAAAGPVTVLKQAFDNQPRDAHWAGDAEARISALFGGDEVPRSMLKTAACRRAVCKVEVAWSQEHATAYLSLEQAAREAFGSELGVEPLGAQGDAKEQQVNLYLSRKGYTLADLSR